MFDTAACHKRAFKSDWAKCLEKGDRFLNIIKKGCTDPKEKAVVKTAEIMERYYPRVLFMFVIYCCMADATNCSWMTFGSFAAFVEDAEIADDESATCRTSDMDTIFKATDFDSTRGKSGNPGKSLTRSEFAEALIRISHAKFGGKGVDAHMVIERLLKHVFARVGDAACRDFRPEWRQRVLYTAPVDKVLKKYEDVLERIFYENDVKSTDPTPSRIRWRSRTSTRTPSRGTRATSASTSGRWPSWTRRRAREVPAPRLAGLPRVPRPRRALQGLPLEEPAGRARVRGRPGLRPQDARGEPRVDGLAGKCRLNGGMADSGHDNRDHAAGTEAPRRLRLPPRKLPAPLRVLPRQEVRGQGRARAALQRPRRVVDHLLGIFVFGI